MEFKNNKWNDWDMKDIDNEYLCSLDICTTTIEDYLIFLGGYDLKSDANLKYIFVYDFKRNKMVKSDIETPSHDEI